MSLSFRNILMRLCKKKKKDRNQEEFVDIIKGIFGNKNGEVSQKTLDLEKKNVQIKRSCKFPEDKHSTMSDSSLIDNLRDLRRLVSKTNNDVDKGNQSVRYRREYDSI